MHPPKPAPTTTASYSTLSPADPMTQFFRQIRRKDFFWCYLGRLRRLWKRSRSPENWLRSDFVDGTTNHRWPSSYDITQHPRAGYYAVTAKAIWRPACSLAKSAKSLALSGNSISQSQRSTRNKATGSRRSVSANSFSEHHSDMECTSEVRPCPRAPIRPRFVLLSFPNNNGGDYLTHHMLY